ncbi:hypothetical protein LINPERPRIM_LOCUS10114 [Linum perenne]
MATSSPAPSNVSSDVGVTPPTPVSLQRIDGATPKTLRGLNKPKCIQCGNVARSRVCSLFDFSYAGARTSPAKVAAQKPKIHVIFMYPDTLSSQLDAVLFYTVLKANTTIPDKAPPSSATHVDQQSVDLSPSTTSLRVASLRQLSNTFSQFNNVHTPRSRKPLTKKEALAINEWRFNKLKEYREGITEKENEAFDRYMQNISLLEEAFSMKSMQDNDHASPVDPMVSENARKRKQRVVDEALRKLVEIELDGERRSEKVKIWSDRASTFNELIEKLNKARNEDDIKSCLEMKTQLFEIRGKGEEAAPLDDEHEAQTSKNESSGSSKGMDCFSQNQLRPVDVDQESVSKIDAHFTSLEKIASL